MKKLLKVLMAVVLVFSCALTSAKPVAAATDAELAGQLIYYYKALADNSWSGVTAPWLNTGRADADVQRILQQMRAQNPEYAAKWEKILNFWNEANTEGFTNVYHPTTDGEGNYIINTEDMVTTFPNDDSLCFFGYGNRMQSDGSMSAENVGRCETLLALAQQYPNAYIMLSGGHTAGAEFDSEAGAMFNWLKAHGVAENRMILDEEALNTVGNITNSMVKLADYPSIKNFVAVTSDYHIPRASVFLMTYIYSNGLDESRGYKFAGTMGWANIPTKYESLSMQASGVGSLSGVSVPRTLTVSTLASVVPVLKSTQIKKGSDLSTIITRVYATLENADETQITEGFEYDITDKVEITGYDPDTTGKQEVTFTWTYPLTGDSATTKSATVTVEVMDVTDAELAGQLIYYYKALADSSWSNVTAPWLNTGFTDADVQRILQQMKAQNPEYGATWQKILDFWNEANSEGFTNVYHPATDGEGNYIINTEDMVTTFPNDDSLCFFGYGNRMQSDGSMSVENVGRCETLLALAQQYPNAYIMLSGGHTAGDQYDSEAGAMFNWLKAHGVAEERMILDEEALSTVGNITNSMVKLADYPQIKNFVAVTSDYHIPRASVFLMTYIYSNGLDESRGYNFVGTMGWANTPTKYESLSMQASGVGQLAGVSVPRTLTVSTLESVVPVLKSTQIKKGTDIKTIISEVYATFTNSDPAQITEGFKYDITDKVEITGYDPDTTGKQEVTFTWSYPGKGNNVASKSATVTIDVMEATDAELAGMIVYYYKALADSSWFNVTAPWLNVGRADADVERILQQLKAQNPEYGAIWQKIVDFWNEANTEGFTNVYHPTTDGEGNYIINTEDMVTTFPNDDSLCFFGYGNRMQADGSMSVENVGRCETLLALAEQYPNAYIMLSGGHTAGAEFDSEAGAMFNWLKAHGVAEERMILDEEALSTVGNITNSMVKLADYPSIKYFVAVTSDYHIPRASVFLMTYIYSNGLDVSRGYEFAGTMGWANTPTKYESLSMQASGVGQLAGVSVPRTLTVSTPATLTVTGLSEGMEIPGGSDITELITGAVATYQNADPAQITEGFTFDVMNKIEVSGYDPQTAGPQEITVSYTYNSETVSVTYNVNVTEVPEYVFDNEKDDSVSDGKATWIIDSDGPLTFTVHRDFDDDLTFSLYQYIDIDGVQIPETYVSATEGSLIIAIAPEYMSTLDEGDHVLTVHFKDGTASISLSVERESVIIPDTGDNSRYGMYSLMAVISMILLAVLRKKSYSY